MKAGLDILFDKGPFVIGKADLLAVNRSGNSK